MGETNKALIGRKKVATIIAGVDPVFGMISPEAEVVEFEVMSDGTFVASGNINKSMVANFHKACKEIGKYYSQIELLDEDE